MVWERQLKEKRRRESVAGVVSLAAGMVGDECAQASPPVSRAIASATRASRLKRATSLMSWPSGSLARATTIPLALNSSASLAAARLPARRCRSR